MRKDAGNRGGLRPRYSLVLRASFAALVFGVTVVLLTPVWCQTPPKPTFADIEKRAAEARDARRLEEAVSLYREGLKLRPSWNDGTWNLGTSLYALNRYAEARDAFQHLAISQPGNGAAWALAGMCEFELKNYQRALEYLLRSEGTGYEENQQLVNLSRFRIALLLNRAGEPEQALARLVTIAAQGTYPEVIEAMGLSLLRAQLLPSEIPEQDRDLYRRAGEAVNAYVAHDSEAAERLFEELVTAYPDRPNVHFARGVFLMETAPERALPEFQREVDLNPSHPLALLKLAKLYVMRGAPDKALPYARRAVKANPNASAPHRILGESLLEWGETPAAIQELGTAERLAPESPQTHFLLAEAYKRAGNRALATKEMAEFERLDRKEKGLSSSAKEVK